VSEKSGSPHPKSESGLSKYPLLWMIEEAFAKGLLINRTMVNHFVLWRPRKGSNHAYVAPDATAKFHVSMTPGWKLLEWLPKRIKWREWKPHRSLLGFGNCRVPIRVSFRTGHYPYLIWSIESP
jgi:hypothetical protein